MSMPYILSLSALAALLICSAAKAQPADANYDEAKVGKYTLPDPLVMQNGEKVADDATWHKRRRPEILQLFQTNVYGRSPGRPENITYELTSLDRAAWEARPCARK